VLKAIDGKGELNILHICRDNIRLHLHSDYPGDVVNWAATGKHNIPLKAGKRLFNRPILGGMDPRGVIVDGTHEEIQNRTHEIIDSYGPLNLIIGADCTLPTDINFDQIRAVIEATSSYIKE